MTITYQTIINEINHIPLAYLQDVYKIIQSYSLKDDFQTQNRKKILEFAGSWNEMSDEDYKDIMSEINRSKEDMFNREIEL